MYRNTSLLAVVPARGGSKGLPGKNIRKCAGKPLIEWTISAAKAVAAIDDVLVSTDSGDIAEVSRNAGASVPFLRPEALSTDHASMLDVLQHAWEEHKTPEGRHYDYMVLLQPTSPLRRSAHIEAAIKHFFDKRNSTADTLVSVYEVGSKFGWLMQHDDNAQYVRFCLDVKTKNPQRQALRNYFLPNGAIFMVAGNAIKQGLYHANTIPYVMSPGDSIDIDSSDDLALAEQRLLALQKPHSD